MLNKLNHRLEALMPIITPVSVIIGILLSHWLYFLVPIVPWIFAWITFSGSIGLSTKEFRRVLAFPLPIIVTLFILHILMPFIALIFGRLLFPQDPLFITGLVLLLVIPTGVISFMWE